LRQGALGVQSRKEASRTGLVCPECRERVAVVEHEAPGTLTFVCCTCGHRWSADAPGGLRSLSRTVCQKADLEKQLGFTLAGLDTT